MMLLCVFGLLLLHALPQASEKNYSAADFSRMAREVVEEMNLVRKDPGAYAEQYIRPRRSSYHGKAYELSPYLNLMTEEGVEALDDCVEALKKAKPAPALSWSSGLARAASDHVKDQGKSGDTGHKGSDHSDPTERMERYGAWKRINGENISYGSAEPREIVIQLLIDDGVSSRGHRENILNPAFRTAGAAIGPHKEFRFMCAMDFAGGFADKKP